MSYENTFFNAVKIKIMRHLEAIFSRIKITFDLQQLLKTGQHVSGQ